MLALFLRFQPFWFCFMSDLLSRLERLRGSEKTVGEVGPTLINWVSITWGETNKQTNKNNPSVVQSHQFRLCLRSARSRLPRGCSSPAWRPTSPTAVTRWGPKLCSTRRKTRSGWSTFCASARSLPSAGNWTCGTSWISHGVVSSNTPCC